MWLSAALARQEDPTDSIRVPILINCWGRLEPCVEDSEARSEPASIVINAGISCSVGWGEHLCQVLTSPIPHRCPAWSNGNAGRSPPVSRYLGHFLSHHMFLGITV